MNHETFEDRLLAKLTEMDAARPESNIQPAKRPATRLIRRPAVLVTATAAAVLLLAGAMSLGSRPATEPANVAVPPPNGNVAIEPASFTVVKNADGTVTFTIHDLLDLNGATRALNDAGIVGRVLTSTADCTTGPNVVPIDPDDLYPADTYHRLAKQGGMVEGDSVTISSSFYPAGGGLLVTVGGGYMRFDGNKLHLRVGYLAYNDANKIPQCVNFVDPGTGDFPVWPPTPRVR